MKYSLLLVALLFSFVVYGQEEDISELEALEQELEMLEAEDLSGDEAEFSESVSEEASEAEELSVEGEELDAGLESLDTTEGDDLAESVEEESSEENEFYETVGGEQEAASDDFVDVESNEETDAFGDFESGEEEFTDFEEDSFTAPVAEEMEPTDEPSFSDTGSEPVGESSIDTTSATTTTAEPTYAEAEPSMQTSQPNLSKEKEIYNAYQYIKNYSQTGQSWPMVMEGRESENYNIQMGDNLWEISLTLFGNPYFWPKIWSLNSDITNPHKIMPGDQLLFVEGNLEQAPILTEGEMPSESAPVEQEEDLSGEELLAQELPSLPPEKQRRPPLKMVPPSLAAWDKSKDRGDDFATGKIQQVSSDISNILEVSSYVSDVKVEGIGQIVEIEGGLNTANLYQYVYIESNSIRPGDRLLAVENIDTIRWDKENVAYPVEVQGVLEVVESVSGEKQVYKAMVKKLVNPIKKGSEVLTRSLPSVRINEMSPMSNISSKIIGGEFDNDRKVLGINSTIYLDQGSNAGLEPGNRLQILKNHKVRRNQSYVETISDRIGIAHVVDVQSNVATAVISDASDYVTVGDLTGSAAVLSLGSDQTEFQDASDTSGEFENFEQEIESDFEDSSDESIESDFF